MFKKSYHISPLVFGLAVMSKGLTAVFLPVSLYFLHQSKISKRKKIRLSIYYGVLAIIGISVLLVSSSELYEQESRDFNWHDLVYGFSALYSSLRADWVIILFLIPLVVALYFGSGGKIIHSRSIIFMILTMTIIPSVLIALTINQNTSYRFLPLIIFFAIGVGTLISKTIDKYELQTNSQ